jgi:hypothetical protein
MSHPDSKIHEGKLDLNLADLPDFWERQAGAQVETVELAPFGVPFRITANRPEPLAAASLSAGRFSQDTGATSAKPARIRVLVRRAESPPLPEDLPHRLVYSGVDDYISVSAGEWGRAFARLSLREAVLVLSPALAAHTRIVSRYLVDHYILNFLLTEWAMLHASCVLSADGQRLIVMIAPHNTGKSTTALHLLRGGYTFLADGMALLQQRNGGFMVGGYPVGEVKLRDDVLSMFPELSGHPVKVREEQKTVIDLRAIHAERLAVRLLQPPHIHLCFMERGDAPETRIEPLSPEQALRQIGPNTVYWDAPSRLAHNTTTLLELVRAARLHRLLLGSSVPGIVAALDSLRDV